MHLLEADSLESRASPFRYPAVTVVGTDVHVVRRFPLSIYSLNRIVLAFTE